MKVLWAPWRLTYVEKPDAGSGCFFCNNPRLDGRSDRREALVLRSNQHVSVVMNRFPYANGHLMVAPRAHTADFAGLDRVVTAALQDELKACVRVLAGAFAPQGFNVGMNLGRVAGAGVTDHMHWHVVPRWQGDTNFMPVLADTKVMPEHVLATYDRLLALFEEGAT